MAASGDADLAKRIDVDAAIVIQGLKQQGAQCAAQAWADLEKAALALHQQLDPADRAITDTPFNSGDAFRNLMNLMRF